MMSHQSSSIRCRLFSEDPYEGLTAKVEEFDAHGWNGKHPIFAQLIKEVRPNLVVEVGTWKGESAITLANAARSLNLQFELVCVDTWLGAPEFWTNKEDPLRYKSFKMRNGFPQVYFTFLNNIVCEGLTKTVTPFPATSFVAQRWFQENKLFADMIYIDASHEYEEVVADIRGWWRQLRSGGIMVGDDYTTVWPGVIRAVEEARESIAGFNFIGLFGEKWVAQKR